jgi:FHA domain/zinc-ribbon domain
MAVLCPSCGVKSAEDANFCPNCGASLHGGAAGGVVPEAARAGESHAGESITAAYRIDESGELVPVEMGGGGARGPALVIRAGGGRVGESFALVGERMGVGRRPDSEVFLDDITVSRDHALLISRGDSWYIDDCGSLNGTYVNRGRIESHRLADGDELQIGKYKLTFHAR